MVRIRICAEPGCKNAQTTKHFCRLHYLKNWRRIHEDEKKKAAQRLNKYVEGICKKFPDRFVEAIRDDLVRGGPEKSNGDFFSRDEIDDLFENLGYQDEANVDQLLSRLKVDKDF